MLSQTDSKVITDRLDAAGEEEKLILLERDFGNNGDWVTWVRRGERERVCISYDGLTGRR